MLIAIVRQQLRLFIANLVSVLLCISSPGFSQELVLDLDNQGTTSNSISAEIVAVPVEFPDSDAGQVRLQFEVRLYSGMWLLNQQDLESPEEQFVLRVFRAHQNLDEAADLESIMDTRTYNRRAANYGNDPGLIQVHANAYNRFDDVRLLCSVIYGPYELFITQLRGIDSGEVIASPMMPAIMSDEGYRLTDGPGEIGDEVFNLFVIGKIHDQLVSGIEDHLNL